QRRRVELFVPHQPRQGQNGRQRRPQLVRHGGEEVVLDRVRLPLLRQHQVLDRDRRHLRELRKHGAILRGEVVLRRLPDHHRADQRPVGPDQLGGGEAGGAPPPPPPPPPPSRGARPAPRPAAPPPPPDGGVEAPGRHVRSHLAPAGCLACVAPARR